MPVAPNPLLQASAVGQHSRTSAVGTEKLSQAAFDKARDFEQMMARQGREASAARDDRNVQAKPKDKPEPAKSGNSEDEGTGKVAEDGNNLPDTEAASRAAGAEPDQGGNALPLAQAIVPAPQPAGLLSGDEAGSLPTDFDPDADPLAGMPALRLALEQSAQAQGATSAHAADDKQATLQANVNTLANPIDGEGESEPGAEALGGLLEEGLKDIKGAASDSRVDDFGDRLAALTQAVTPKTANVVPATSPLQQPLAMNQNAWSEGLVNRVMYLSSQNLKSADIQLEPAELGRLDIRINVAPDQAAQITFISGHAGVRDTLDSQLYRLRELFAQQGLAQPDVNVADQSRGQQSQQGQQQGTALSGVAARRTAAGESDSEVQADARQPGERQVVIGSSAVDYYA
ncbi:flagellar hook-length control protein FliK [Pseudomonas capeferrum]|uniref:flagellar hook-length control protein FliK n=1 Tax=Pseudomonas capeferrum TaxID=1495066 RepID=UPI0015E3EF8E|nr:flagellar hook-length control protein FliK [Pseudomonas capeferrum]MBA1200849.1 flagellar hook-length control protein FliK [Pseudomonas capeferrum]